MFPYDAELLACLQTPPYDVAGVLAIMQTIDNLTVPADGLKWFNGLYFKVTQAVDSRLQSGGFSDAAFLSQLDVQFAWLYFDALGKSLAGKPVPACWQALFSVRNHPGLTRIQCALAGINAHINHDLPLAIQSTCQAATVAPQHSSVQYADYTSLNPTLDGLIEEAKHTLNVGMLGEAIPAGSVLEDTFAAWSVSAARETAWNNAELLWHLETEPGLTAAFLDSLDGLSTVVGKVLLTPLPDLEVLPE
jgi:hypothetical protein